VNIRLRFFVWILLGCVAFVPTISRTQQPFTTGHSPTQEYSRFRWSNSCESAQSRTLVVAPAVTIARPVVDSPLERAVPRWNRAAPDDVLLPPGVPQTPSGLRAPPFFNL
jgi:hypothetical protein